MRPRLRPVAAVVVAVAAMAVPATSASAQGAPRQRPCPGQQAFTCATLSVPLDHSGAVGGTIALRYAAARTRTRTRTRSQRRRGRVLIALSGGPGQPSIESAGSFAISLEPALSRYRLVVLDQRGTGRSGVLRCPEVQRLRSLDAFLPGDVAACAARIGPRRAFYSTADTVLDLEDLRRRLGVEKVALMGISYGTHVALQYARAFPQNVDRLILDSIVGPDGPDAFLLDTYRNLPRVLREQCRGTRCDGVTSDPVADVAALVQRMNTGGPLRGTYFDDRGRRRPTLYRNPDELAFLLLAGDLNPFLQAALPAAIAAARRGDTSLLMRLRRIGQGGRTPTAELSFGLNVATGCADAPLPYSLATPLEQRAGIAQAALAAIPPAQYTPFDGHSVLRSSYVDDCLRWPQDAPRRPYAGPLPDVPALLLGGRLDVRTPIENAHATARQLPRASVVTLRGAGHDSIDSDLTGCIARALDRFIGNRRVGAPCSGRENGVPPLPRPPRLLGDFRSAPGVGGRRGRALFAVLDTVQDARLTSLQQLYANLPTRGGGLRGGRFSGPGDLDGTMRLRRYAYLAGLRVSGRVEASGSEITGRVSVRGPRGTSGSLTLGVDGVTGRLGGRAVRYRQRSEGSVVAASGRRVGGYAGDGPVAVAPRRSPASMLPRAGR